MNRFEAVNRAVLWTRGGLYDAAITAYANRHGWYHSRHWSSDFYKMLDQVEGEAARAEEEMIEELATLTDRLQAVRCLNKRIAEMRQQLEEEEE